MSQCLRRCMHLSGFTSNIKQLQLCSHFFFLFLSLLIIYQAKINHRDGCEVQEEDFCRLRCRCLVIVVRELSWSLIEPLWQHGWGSHAAKTLHRPSEMAQKDSAIPWCLAMLPATGYIQSRSQYCSDIKELCTTGFNLDSVVLLFTYFQTCLFR